MFRRFALTLFALLLVAALPLSPGIAQTGTPPPPATTAAATDDSTASEASQAKADADAKREAEAATKTPDIGRIASLLAGVFALAAVIEAALAVIFAWPVFLDRINRRNAKMPISLVVSGIVAWGFDLQLVHKLAAAFGAGSGQNLPGEFDALLSALILAGGAAGVRNLMVSLGLATPTAELEKPAKPPSNRAWLSVRDERSSKDTPLTIWLETSDSSGKKIAPFIVGAIAAGNHARSGLARIFLTDRSRFPVIAGYAVDVGKAYDIHVVQGSTAPAAASTPRWKDYAFGEGAIVDLLYP